MDSRTCPKQKSEKRSKKALGTLQKDMEIDLKQYINSTHSLQC